MKTIIITNNPKVNIEYFNTHTLYFYPNLNQEDILIKARDLIHIGGKILIHPMMGRIKPHETPYKSIILDSDPGNIDMESIRIIEDSIKITKKYLSGAAYKKYYDEILEDLQFADKTLLESGIQEMRGYYG